MGQLCCSESATNAKEPCVISEEAGDGKVNALSEEYVDGDLYAQAAVATEEATKEIASAPKIELEGIPEANESQKDLERSQAESVPQPVSIKRTGTESLMVLEESQRQRVHELIKGHYIFEAYELCPEYVECKGYMKNFRDTVNLLCGDTKINWHKTLQGDLGDGDKWKLQYYWGGKEPGSTGKEYLWVKLSTDQGIPWWKSLAGWQEPDLDCKGNPLLVESNFVGKPTPCYGVRCNIQGLAGRLFGYTQDYVEVFRYICPESGVCVECDRSVDHEDLKARGCEVGEAKYKKGNDMLLYTISFPRSENKSTTILFSRLQLFLPGWLVNKLINNIGPRLLKNSLPTMMERQGSDPEFLERYEKDKDGVYKYLREFERKSLAAAEKRTEKYSSEHLPPAKVVLGSFSEAREQHVHLPAEDLSPHEYQAPKAGQFPSQPSTVRNFSRTMMP
mmetsp:Transcript_6854/g.12238  ORF Transcript_6854/g.12238 Transcript_6854/m.12238 type:complete len:448 (+) Transcript_6854:3-1346(+)